MSCWDYYSFIAEGDSFPTFCYRIKYNGNTIAVQFGPVKQYSGRPVYSVCLSIFRKRRREDIEFYAGSITGTIGVSGLLLAKESFDLFIDDVFKETDFDSLVLSVQGLDSRRYKIYKRSLERMGYVKSRLLGSRCVSKIYYRSQ